MRTAVKISVVVPALDEAATLEATLGGLAPLRAAGGEVIVVDGGSIDATGAIARAHADRVVMAPPGRARQMNTGAASTDGDLLWFVHADARVDRRAHEHLLAAFRSPQCEWARFGVRLSGRRLLFRAIAVLMNLRSRVTGIATGDQAICVRRSVFEAIGGFPEVPLMEDVALSRALRRRSRPACLPVGVTTSSRRWERGGAWRTVWLMWALRLAYWRGADPAVLARRYDAGRTG